MSSFVPRRALEITLVVAASLAGLPSCDDTQDTDPAGMQTEDRAVYEHTHRTLATVPLLAYVAELFKADVSWKSLDPAVAAKIALAVTQARIDYVLGSFQCERTLESDGATYLAGTFANCTIVEHALQGDFRAELTIESEPCPADPERECSAAVRWSLGGPDFSLGKAMEDSARFVGPMMLRDSIRHPEEPMTWETQPGFSLEVAGGEKFATRSTAEWLVDEDTNCMDISLDARLDVPQIMQDDLQDIEIGEIVISASDVHYCPTQCPTMGSVEMAYGRGNILSWAYDGSDEVVVSGPGGREFTASLPCPKAR